MDLSLRPLVEPQKRRSSVPVWLGRSGSTRPFLFTPHCKSHLSRPVCRSERRYIHVCALRRTDSGPGGQVGTCGGVHRHGAALQLPAPGCRTAAAAPIPPPALSAAPPAFPAAPLTAAPSTHASCPNKHSLSRLPALHDVHRCRHFWRHSERHPPCCGQQQPGWRGGRLQRQPLVPGVEQPGMDEAQLHVLCQDERLMCVLEAGPITRYSRCGRSAVLGGRVNWNPPVVPVCGTHGACSSVGDACSRIAASYT